jgi:hypothetical protein
MQMPTVIRHTILITHQEISKAILNNVVSTLITKDLKSPFVIVTLRMLLRITMEMQVLLVNLGAITKRFSIFKF